MVKDTVVNSAGEFVAGELTALIGSFLFDNGLLVSDWLGDDFELEMGEGALVDSLELVPTPNVTGEDMIKSSIPNDNPLACDDVPNKLAGTS